VLDERCREVEARIPFSSRSVRFAVSSAKPREASGLDPEAVHTRVDREDAREEYVDCIEPLGL
jgi:hypothetical protein